MLGRILVQVGPRRAHGSALKQRSRAEDALGDALGDAMEVSDYCDLALSSHLSTQQALNVDARPENIASCFANSKHRVGDPRAA